MMRRAADERGGRDAGAFLRSALLDALGVEHGFGQRGCREPDALVRPRQVHGAAVAAVRGGAAAPAEADAIVALRPGQRIGVVTADCVPVLLLAGDGVAVAAVHAGWRGLAAGVVEAGVAALAAHGGAPRAAAVGPHIGPCCYEVDAPVLAELHARFADALDAALRPARPGRALLDLGALTRHALEAAGLAPDAIERLEGTCTRCDERFHSYRRDGPRAGRLVHYVAAGGGAQPEP